MLAYICAGMHALPRSAAPVKLQLENSAVD